MVSKDSFLQTSTDGCAPALRVRRRAAEFVQQTCYVESVSPHVHKRQAQQVPCNIVKKIAFLNGLRSASLTF